jgi:hypothetical protein
MRGFLLCGISIYRDPRYSATNCGKQTVVLYRGFTVCTRSFFWGGGGGGGFAKWRKATVRLPVWTYGIELWGCATKSNIAVIQRYQSKLLRTITNVPWYVSSQTLHSDLHIPHVSTVFRERTATHHTTLDSHPNPLVEPLVHPPNNRCLKRRWTFDETH